MKVSKRIVVAGLAAVPTGLVVGGERLASAHSQGDVIGELANNEGIFVDQHGSGEGSDHKGHRCSAR
jgi:hypothetical protein